MKINEKIYEAIKKSLTNDMQIAYDVFKEEDYENLRGVRFCMNPSSEFSKYLKGNPEKMADLTEHLFCSLNFDISIVFNIDEDDEFYPLLD